ncbi:TetR/AcrR family transcriptional regulator [Mycolicibacter sp. MYC123]|uniref:TetR/AcrR family transcriptional regulator n=1 Tax=[Mycobacterium] zoologicum TaxID=2872311 RepID=A0ABU5YLU6_9MYCO|nr:MULTISPECIES: TetR/AcrR family transcriptional regulator [unclassified Mycolicibacter]MEB3049949.1 TetR/AcrR family transcriptional regulator [Mycolicibacter sp. MYC123]MEB3063188.1 TetR/AcrR family transcriptional regulator [Mycolicibacter sp. MYC101]
MPGDNGSRTPPPPLLAAATETLRRLGPRRFSLTAVAEEAGVSRGTVHNVFGTRDDAIAATLGHLSAAFIDTMAAEVNEQASLAEQVAAAAVLISAHRRRSAAEPRAINQSVLVLLLEHGGEELMRRSVQLWTPMVRAAQHRGEVDATLDAGRAGEWIVRMLFSFELLPPMRVNLDSPRAVRNFVCDHIVAGLRGDDRG